MATGPPEWRLAGWPTHVRIMAKAFGLPLSEEEEPQEAVPPPVVGAPAPTVGPTPEAGRATV